MGVGSDAKVSTFLMVLTGLLGIFFACGAADMRGAALFMAFVCAISAAIRDAE